jgi:hypothetical protein
MNKYLFLYRGPHQTESPPPHSSDEMKAMFAAWDSWKNKFKASILDMGDGLKGTGKVLKGGTVTDGPHIESKEVIGGYSLVQAESYEQALAVAAACPIHHTPGAYIEVREMAGFG